MHFTKIFGITLLLLCTAITGWASCIITGKIQIPAGGKYMLSLSEIGNQGSLFNTTTKYMMTSTDIENDVAFQLTVDKFQYQNALFRLELKPRESLNNTILYNSMPNENFIFLALADQQEIYLEADAERFSQSVVMYKKHPGWDNLMINKVRQPIYQFVADLDHQKNELAQQGLSLTDSVQTAIFTKLEKLAIENNKKILAMIMHSPNVFDIIVGLFHYDYDMETSNDLAVYESALARLKSIDATHMYVQQLDKIVKEAKQKLEIQVFPNFTLPDINGKEIKLSDIQSELIIIDFWASWCGPCVQQNKLFLKPLFEQYKDITIVGVSIDSDPEKWKKSVAQQDLKWINVLENQENPTLSRMFNITAIPTVFILDGKTKTILKRNLHGEFLVEYVKSVLEK